MSHANHWTDPGADEVAEGVYRIPLPLPSDALKAVNVYVLDTEDGLTCVDGGWALEVSRKQFEESLGEIGRHPREITSFLVTHAHRDHYTQAVALRNEFGRAAVALGVGERETLATIRSQRDHAALYATLHRGGADDVAAGMQEMLERNAEADRSVWMDPDAWLEGGEVIRVGDRELTVVATPGHTAGHVIYADLASEVLFAGDHVLPTITPSIGLEPVHVEQPLGNFLSSLATILQLPDMVLFPAHGGIGVRSHGRALELLAHHEHRLSQCLTAVRGGATTAYDVAKELPWTRHERRLSEMDIFNNSLAVTETMAHLDLLSARGDVVRVLSVDSTARYEAPNLPDQ